MKILAGDDEELALEMLISSIKEACKNAEISAFMKPSELLECAKREKYDIAFLDIQMRGITGLELAKKLKEINPKINIIFVTGYDEYAGKALTMHASGYVMKPVTPEKISKELCDLRYPVEQKEGTLLKIQCFGNFEVFTPDGNPLRFERLKSKEVFAYLVYKRGSACTIKEIAAAIFEDAEYNRKQLMYMQKIISSLTKTLKSTNAEAVFKRDFNSLAINPSLVRCDYYDFESFDPAAVNAYNGEFMSQYSWAEFILGYLEKAFNDRK